MQNLYLAPTNETPEVDFRYDADTLQRIVSGRNHIGDQDACGATAIRGLLHLASEFGMKGELLDYRNSGDTAGDKSRVVGYAAVVFTEESR